MTDFAGILANVTSFVATAFVIAVCVLALGAVYVRWFAAVPHTDTRMTDYIRPRTPSTKET